MGILLSQKARRDPIAVKHNSKDDAATHIAKLMVAAIAQGDFKTKSSFASSDLTAPPNTLKVADYLDNNLDSNRDDLVLNQLLSVPQTATATPQKIQSYIALDFKAYLEGIALLLEQVQQEKRTTLEEKLLPLQKELLVCIQGLQGGDNQHYKKFQKLIQTICTLDGLPGGYVVAIQRIAHLLDLQHKIDPELEQTRIKILIEQGCSELLDVIMALEEKAKILHEYFSCEYISQENEVGIFLTQLKSHAQSLDAMKCTLLLDTKPVVSTPDEMGQDLDKSIAKQSSLEAMWLEVSPLSLQDLALYQDQIQKIDQFLKEMPRVISESSLLKAQTIIHEHSSLQSTALPNVTLNEEVNKKNNESVLETKVPITSTLFIKVMSCMNDPIAKIIGVLLLAVELTGASLRLAVAGVGLLTVGLFARKGGAELGINPGPLEESPNLLVLS